MADNLLIGNLVKRLEETLELPEDVHGGQVGKDSLRSAVIRETDEVLVALSVTCMNTVARSLHSTLNNTFHKLCIAQLDEAILRHLRSVVFLLDLLWRCLRHQWDSIREKYRNMEGLNETEQLRLKEKEELLCPPPLEDSVATDLVRLLHKIIHVSVVHRENEAFRGLAQNCGHAMFQISSTNAEAVYKQGAFFQDLNDEVGLQVSFIIMENLNLNSRRLSELLQKLCKIVPSIKKDVHRFGVARSLRKAIWNWIDNFPIEFVSLCKTGARLPGNPDTLFDLFDSWASGNVKKSNYWPLQMLLLILCPDIMLQVTSYSEKKKSKSLASKAKFLDALRKGIKTPKLADAVAVCYVDICKAATFVSKSLQSGVRHIVPEIEIELKERLFVPQKGEFTLDRAVMVDCLVAFFRLSHRKVMNSLFNDCLRPEYPPAFRLVLVECLLRIVREGASLPWNPSITDVYSTHSGNLRALFQDLLKDVMGTGPGSADTPKPSKSSKSSSTSAELSSITTETLLKLIELFNADPKLALHPSKATSSGMDDIQGLIVGLCRCAAEFSVDRMAGLAAQALINVHDPENIRRWTAEDAELIPTFWLISSKVNSTLAASLIGRRDIRADEVQALVTLIEEILRRRNEFLTFFGGEVRPSPTAEKVRSSRLKDLEVALLIYLTSSRVQIISTCASCFDLLVKEAQIVDVEPEAAPTNTILTNLQVYQQIRDRIVSDYTSRKAQQKMLWELLRRVQTHTAGNFGAWEEVYHRWCVHTQLLLSTEEEGRGEVQPLSGRGRKQGLSEVRDVDMNEVLQEWSNCTGFLAALSGICLKVERPLESVSKGRIVNEKNFVVVVDAFVDQLLELVVCDNVNIRESVKMVVGSALSPAAYPSLFRHLMAEIRKTFGSAGQIQITELSTLFVDQTISISKLILESETASPEDFSNLIDFDDLLLDVLRYLGQLPHTITSILMKTRLCGLMEAMVKQRNYINVRNEFQLRNQLIGIAIEWTSEFAKGDKRLPHDSGKELAQKVKALDLACMRAIKSLVRGLPLAGKDDQEKSNLFSKHFSFFTQLLTRCKKDASTVLPELSGVTVQCLSHLVSENIEHGLEYFATMGYHEDIYTRSAFLNVLTNILKQGAKLEGEDKVDGKGKYDKLVDLLLEPDMKLVLALSASCQITEADEVSELLVRFFDSNGSVMKLLRTAIDEEVRRTDFVNTLFRRNSQATKLLTNFSKLVGKQYLKETIAPIMRTLLSRNETFELDPAKIQAESLPRAREISAENLSKVMEIATRFLTSIRSSVPNCPASLCSICSYLADAVSRKFPGNEETAVCGFIFLRFFCPAIVAPESSGIVQGQMPTNLRRGLVLVTKALQNLANKVQFVKEPYMEPMNAFITGNIELIGPLCDAYISQAPRDGAVAGGDEEPSHFNQTEEEREEDVERMHYHLHRRFESINKILRNLPSEEGQKSIYDRFQTVMQQLGNPVERKPEAKARQIRAVMPPRTKNEMFENFMRKFETNPRPVETIKQRNLLYEKGRAKDGAPVLYYIAARYANHLDSELFLYYCMKVLQPFFNNHWHLVVDCTLFSAMHEMALPQCVTLDKILPETVRDTLVRVYLLNPNTAVKKYTKRVVSRFVSPAFAKKMVITSPSGLEEYIAQKELALPASTLGVENSIKATFSPVMKVGAQFKKREIMIRLSSELFQMVPARPVQIFGQDVTVVDLVPILNIYEVDMVEDNDFYVKFSYNGQKSLQFRSPAARQIVQQLKAAKDRLNMSSKHIRQRSFRPSDVRGTLLNMALLNLGSNNIYLREAAYNLLAAIADNFNFFVRSQVFEAKGMHIPRNSSHFVTSLSEKLAQTHKDLTLEFLLEASRSIKKGDTHTRLMCLNYIAPWIPNLAMYCHPSSSPESRDKVAKAEEVMKSLIGVTIENPVSAPIILQKVWTVVGSVSDLLPISLDCIIAHVTGLQAAGADVDSSVLGILQDMTIAIAARTPKLIAGKLIARVIRLLRRTVQAVSQDLPHDNMWPEICLSLELLLPLSFDNLICVQQFLPDIFFVIILVFGLGSLDVRHTVHQLLVNVVHSLYTSLLCDAKDDNDKEEEEAEWVERIPQLLADIDQLNFRLYFGLGGKTAHGAVGMKRRGGDEKGKHTSLAHVEPVGSALVEVLAAVSYYSEDLGRTAHARLLSLVTMAGFASNKALQPRAVVTLGILCKSPQVVTEDLFANILRILRESLKRMKSRDATELPVAAILCLSKMYEHLPVDSRFFQPVFWVAVTLLQMNNVDIFQAALSLMEVTLKTLEERGCFQDKGVAQHLLSVRTQLEPELTQLDQVTGISFISNFSFALAAHLLKGFRNASTKTSTVRVLSTLVDLQARKAVGAEMLGYLAVLLPITGEEMPHLQQLLLPAAEHDPSPHSLLFTEQMIPDSTHAALLFSLLSTMLKTSEFEVERLFIYKCLKCGVNMVPEAFPVVYDDLVEHMSQAIQTSQSKLILEEIMAITKSMFAWDQPGGADRLDALYLHKIGFQGLGETDTFVDRKRDDAEKVKSLEQKRTSISRLAVRLLDRHLHN